jgi:hypothetical protein
MKWMSLSSPDNSLAGPDRKAVGAVLCFCAMGASSGAGKLVGRRTRRVARRAVLASDDTGIDQLSEFVIGIAELRQ